MPAKKKTRDKPLTFHRVDLPSLAGCATDQANETLHRLYGELGQAEARMRAEVAAPTFAEQMRLHGPKPAFTFIDLLCGGGGSSAGLAQAGGQLLFGANHSSVAIATHARNFPGSAHACVDLNWYDMRNLPEGADVLWASVICTETSPAGGRSRKGQAAPGQGALIDATGQPTDPDADPVEEELFERTRATAQDVIRAAELWRFPVVCVENVVEFATDWRLFAWWLDGFKILGYRRHIVNASSAHLSGEGFDPAAQWRNRIYIIFVREDLPDIPDLEPRPLAWCNTCADMVESHQVWTDPNGQATASGQRIRVGKYREQYWYHCPAAGHGRVEPATKPAGSIIDWSHVGPLIGERPLHRKKPLVQETMRRVAWGIKLAREGKLSPAWLDANGGSWNTGPAGTDRPFRTRTANDWEALVTPGAFVDTARRNTLPRSPGEPLTTVATARHHGIVVPYRKNNRPSGPNVPLHAVSTIESAALITAAQDLPADPMLWHYRMVTWLEQALAQDFPPGYELAGNQGERNVQVGNAVSVNAARYFGLRFASVLAGIDRR